MRRTALVVAILVSTSCTSVTPTPTPQLVSFAIPTHTPGAFGQECRNFQPDPSDKFFTPTNLIYNDDALPDWPTAEPAEVDLNRQLIERASDNAALSTDVNSLLIVKDGRLVWERYYNGAGPSDAYLIASVSKPILGLLTGIAIEDGLLSLDTTLGEVLPENLVGAHRDLTIENLLTMSAGLRLKEPDFVYDEDVPSDVPGEPSFVRAVLARESVDPPGTKFAYSTGLTQVLAAVLTEITGQSLCEYAANELLGPLGIEADGWWIEPDGYFAGGHSVFMTPRELAVFGQLILDHGKWEGTQLVPEDWLDVSLSERWDLGCQFNRPVHQGYGYLWWLYDLDGYTVWNASGWGGQEIWLVPELGLEVLMTHDSKNAYEPGNHQIRVGNLIRAAVTDALPPKDDPMCASDQFDAVSIRTDGTERETIAGWPVGAFATGWSGGQDRLLVTNDRLDLNTEIYSLAPNGTGQIRLTNNIDDDTMPAWSPTGTFVVYANGTPDHTDLYTVRHNGDEEPIQLTDYEGSEQSPTWSPDGQEIAFVWSEDANGFGATGPLWSVAADGTGGPRMRLDRQVGYPVWSPDGQHIALEIREGEPHLGVLDLTTLNVADLGPGFVPSWSPDGSRIAYIRPTFSSFEIFTINPDGTGELQLTDDTAFDTFPIWSPDGATIRFMSRDGE